VDTANLASIKECDMSHHLRDEQVEEYRAEGFLECGNVLDADEVAELIERVDLLVAEYTDRGIELSTRPGTTYTLITPVHTRDARYRELILENTIVLDIVESILGPVFRLVEDQVFYKPPGGAPLANHHDNIYYGWDAPKIVTCWIALDEATPENGCLRVLPCSHRQNIEHRRVEDTIIKEAQINEEDMLDVPAPPGHLIILDGLTVHGSGPNTTTAPRRAANMVCIIPTPPSPMRSFDDESNPFLRTA
jgi:hypothetical protein